MTQTAAEMLAEAQQIEDGTHPLFGASTPTMVRRLAAKTLRDRAADLRHIHAGCGLDCNR